jgi:hypothetical protein
MIHGVHADAWLPGLLALAGGVWLRDCVLLAAAPWFAFGGFLHRMDRDSPQHALAAALRCICAGVGVLLAAGAIAVALAAAWLDWWQPANDQPILVAALLASLFGVYRWLPDHAARPARLAELGMLMLALATLGGEVLGLPLICCAAALSAAAALAWAGWRLLRCDARFLLSVAR